MCPNTPDHWPLWPMENLKLYLTFILGATNGHRHRSFLQIVWKVSDQQNQHPETIRVSTQLIYTRQAVAVSGNGLHGTIALCSNYRVEIGAVGIKNLEDLANRNSSVTVRTLRRENASGCLNPHIPCFCPLLQLRSVHLSERVRCV